MDGCLISKRLSFFFSPPGLVNNLEASVLLFAGVWISFSRHSPNWRVVQYFHSPSQKTTSQKYRKGQWEGKKPSPDRRVGLYFYSPILKFYSHSASCRVVIRTPDYLYSINPYYTTVQIYLSRTIESLIHLSGTEIISCSNISLLK
jgi:hypothetical protein